MWWPQIDVDIEKTVKGCLQCEQLQKAPAQAPLHPWEWPSRPWVRVHVDYAGPFLGKMFLVLIDSHSKWMEVQAVSSANTSNTIDVLRSIFSSHGLPEIIVSDNGTAFTSIEFAAFLKQNGIQHLCSAPYHPVTYGLAERAFQIFKRSMKKSTTGDIPTKPARFLFHYRTTPHATTGVTPAELLMERQIRTHLDFLKPDVSNRVRLSQSSQKAQKDRKAKARSFSQHEKVFVRETSNDSPWVQGDVESKQGELTYLIRLNDGRIVCRHIEQLRNCSVEDSTDTQDISELDMTVPLFQPVTPVLRRSSRICTQPDRFE